MFSFFSIGVHTNQVPKKIISTDMIPKKRTILVKMYENTDDIVEYKIINVYLPVMFVSILYQSKLP